ncbi:MAG: MauE/DoxX family redox-associated membrane protein [Planctomycetota bacterium]
MDTAAEIISDTQAPEVSTWRENVSVITRCIAGSILFLAAAAKTHELIYPLQVGAKDSPLYQSALILFEIIWACWLFSGFSSKIARIFSICGFSFFAAFAATRWLSGDASCGCFGRQEIPPWLTLCFDLILVFGFAISWPELLRAKQIFVIRFGVVVAGLTLVFGGIFLIVTDEPTLFGPGLARMDSGALVVTDPNEWVGHEFPLINYINLNNDLRDGRWDVIFFRHDCPYCRRKVPQLLKNLKSSYNPSSKRYAFIEVPPLVDHDLFDQIPDEAVKASVGSLDADIDWTVPVPLDIAIDNEIVLDVQVGSR